jgi:RimJ/RimL family protein N-acetyltransferase
MDNPKVWRYTDGYPGEIDDQKGIEMIRLAQDNVRQEIRAVVHHGCIVGLVHLMFDQAYPECAVEMAYMLGEQHWGNGLATSLVHAYIHDVRRRRGNTVFAAYVKSEIKASVRVLKNCGHTNLELPSLQSRFS